MKKIFTTLCAIALTTVMAQAQNRDADAAVKSQEVKKEAPASVNMSNTDASNAAEISDSDRAKYEAYKQQQLKARKSKAVEGTSNNSGDVKRITNSEERKQKASQANKRVLTPEQQKAREEKMKRDN